MDFPFQNRHARAMPRPRAFDEDKVVEAAKELFWDQGYLATSVGDLEDATGLSRSSLYMAFGNKRDLFDAALAVYLTTFIDPLLSPLERADAGLHDAARYFTILATLFKDPAAQRGCLMINTIAESAGRDKRVTRLGEEFLDRLRAAFANALQSSVRARAMTRAQATQRTTLLKGAVVGAWITVRADPPGARALCRSAAAEVEAWVPAP